jgi:putative tryptophan/tyrosine transport system substrate-binding protein
MGMKHDATGRRKTFCFALCALLVALGLSAEAQQPKKVPRVGLLIASSPSPASPRIEAFLQGLRELDYVEGKDIAIEYRYAEGNPDRLPALAAELVSLKIDIIVTGGSSPTRAAKEATVTIPIVMTQDIDPVGSGFVASLARPGGNITGLSNFAPELSGKRIELLKEIVPKISRVAVLGALSLPANAQALKEVKAAAEALRVKLQHLDIQNPTDIESAFRAASKGRAEAALALPGAVLISHRTQIAGFAAKNRLPTIYYATEFVEDGGLMSYAPNFADLSRRAATYVDKILKGAKPADIPVEQPKKFEFVINLKAAKQIGVTIPPNVLARADRVIR